jgi:hypothetical protein
MRGIVRRFRGGAANPGSAVSHFARNYLLSRYGMVKTAHAIRRTGSQAVGTEESAREEGRVRTLDFVP